MRPPRQARSLETLENTLAAAEALLEETQFERLSVLEIVERAGSSIGAFYGRFRDKSALLEALDDAVGSALRGRFDALSGGGRGEARPLDLTVRDLIGTLVRFHREHRGVLRALALRRGTRAETEMETGPRAVRGALSVLPKLLLKRRDAILHPNPELAVHLGFTMVLGVLRSRVLFSEGVGTSPPITDALLADELATAYLAYLRAPR